MSISITISGETKDEVEKAFLGLFPQRAPLELFPQGASPEKPATAEAVADEPKARKKRRTKAEMEAARAAEVAAEADDADTDAADPFDTPGDTDTGDADAGDADDTPDTPAKIVAADVRAAIKAVSLKVSKVAAQAILSDVGQGAANITALDKTLYGAVIEAAEKAVADAAE